MRNDNANLVNPLYTVSEETAQLHIAEGNSKIGRTIYAISTLPGNEEHKLIVKGTTLLTDIPGTCSKHCETCFDKGCYAVNSAKQHHNVVIEAWAENTLLLRAGKLFDKVEQFIASKNPTPEKAKVKTFRINVSGELQTYAELEAWNDIARNHPETTFGIYTKNYEALEQFMQEYGDTQPNLVVNVSQWHGVADEFLAKYPGKFNIFEYDDSNKKKNKLSDEERARLAGLTHCPAVTWKGKHAKNAAGDDITCDMCKRCYRKTGSTTAVYSH